VVSRDGSRIAAATANTVDSRGLIIDVATRQVLNTPDTTNMWTSAAWDPSGALITPLNGQLVLRDGTTAAPLSTIPTTTSPTLPIVSPNGASLAYATLEAGTDSTVGKELLVHTWNSSTLGPPRVVIPADGRGIKEPSFSSDGAWILYSRTATLGAMSRGKWDGAAVTRVDASATYPVSSEPTDNLARWVGDFAPASVGGAAPEPMGWIVMASHRPIGATTPSTTANLWLLAFYPDRGVFSRPFLLPGQDHTIGVLHAPRHVPF
jgi:Tol biopolymer transport system component